MALNLPLYNPTVRDIPAPQPGTDFVDSALKGYKLGRVIAGIPQQQDALEIANLQQQMAQREQLFPTELAKLREDLKNAPINRQLAIAEGLQKLSPGLVPQAGTRPSLPLSPVPSEVLSEQPSETFGATPETIATRLAGDIAYKPVSDAINLNILGAGNLAYSPTKAREQALLEKGLADRRFYQRYDYRLANPIQTQAGYQQTNLVDENGQPLLFNPKGQDRGYYRMSGEKFEGTPLRQQPSAKPQLVKDALGKSSWVYPPNSLNPYGKVVPVLDNSEEQLIQGSTEGRAIRDDFEKLKMGETLIDNLYGEFQKVVQSGNVGILQGNLAKGLNELTGGVYDPQLQAYQDEAKGLLASLRGITGDDARFSDTDAARLFGLLAEASKDPAVAENKFRQINQMIESRKGILTDRLKKGSKFGLQEESNKSTPRPKFTIREKK